MKKQMTKILLALITLSSTMTFAQDQSVQQKPLKLQRPMNDAFKVCKAGSKSFNIKNSDDQAACDQMKKPNPKGNATPPRAPIGSPNPIAPPPTGM